jgi:hypothetical protein
MGEHTERTSDAGQTEDTSREDVFYHLNFDIFHMA